MSRKTPARHAALATRKIQHGTRPALAALIGAWIQSVVSRPDQRLGWQDVGIGVGLAALLTLRRFAKG